VFLLLNNFFNFEKIFDYFNYIFCFFILNCIFLLFNLPIILFFIFIGISNIGTYLPLFLICMIPTMPTFTILLYCMNKLVINKDISIKNDFVKGFKMNFFPSLGIWIIELILIFMLQLNIKYFSLIKINIIFVCIFTAISLILAFITPYIFILISKFKMSYLPLLRTASILSFTRPILSISNLLLFVLALIIFEIIPSTSILFIFSLLAFVLMFINRALINELEDLSKKQTS
jgi:uncharacterized membrane protein YesL